MAGVAFSVIVPDNQRMQQIICISGKIIQESAG
jgi:hypothetical protein